MMNYIGCFESKCERNSWMIIELIQSVVIPRIRQPTLANKQHWHILGSWYLHSKQLIYPFRVIEITNFTILWMGALFCEWARCSIVVFSMRCWLSHELAYWYTSVSSYHHPLYGVICLPSAPFMSCTSTSPRSGWFLGCCTPLLPLRRRLYRCNVPSLRNLLVSFHSCDLGCFQRSTLEQLDKVYVSAYLCLPGRCIRCYCRCPSE